MALGEKIQNLRLRANLSQKELADKLGIATGTLQQYELGKREPRLEMINKIARTLKVSIAQLIDDDFEATTETVGSIQYTHFYCKICDWSFNPQDEVDLRYHFEHHKKYLNAVKVFGNLIKYQKAKELSEWAIKEMRNKNNSDEKIYKATKTFFKANFSCSVMDSNYDINHISFSGYVWLELNKKWIIDILPDNVYFRLIHEYKKEGINESDCYPRRFNTISIDDREDERLKKNFRKDFPKLNQKGRQKVNEYIRLLVLSSEYITDEEKECRKVRKLQ